MSVEITGRYVGDLVCEAVHGPSGSLLRTEAPVDNGGTGSEFSPTDLVATALATCLLTIVALHAKRDGYSIDGARFRIEKHMSEERPRRIVRLPLVVDLPATVPVGRRAALEAVARHCPVWKSLSPDIAVDVTFRYEQ